MINADTASKTAIVTFLRGCNRVKALREYARKVQVVTASPRFATNCEKVVVDMNPGVPLTSLEFYIRKQAVTVETIDALVALSA